MGGYLGIGDLPAVENLDGLANITSVGGSLYIQNNAALTNLDGLANIASVGDQLAIRNNAALTNLDGLASITSLAGNLSIYRNYKASCEGVAQLLELAYWAPADSVVGDIIIGDNGEVRLGGADPRLGVRPNSASYQSSHCLKRQYLSRLHPLDDDGHNVPNNEL